VEDLHELVRNCGEERPALVGESWGAMLALAYAAAHPADAGRIVLVGCGTFDKASRERMNQIIIERTDPEMQLALAELDRLEIDRDERIMRKFAILEQIYAVDPLEPEAEAEEMPLFDSRAHKETWQDMLTLQERGVYPAAFAAITSPVLMLHGEEDPHPGEMIRKSLAPYISGLEYHALKRCGHSPWCERAARGEFFEVLKRWLRGQG
jgi:pimeloyl-ACP methyl ester carboxylesterase